LNPIGDIYKSQVWQLAEEMGVPRVIIDKKPSADLWAGQTDEQELGFTYREVDELLYHLVDLRYSREELAHHAFALEFVDLIYSKVQNSHFKRRLPIIAKVSQRTIDRDFRYSRDWGK
jgi:NAD+ synthase